MPKATVSHDTIRKDLKTCPGGYVELRTLSFHEMQTRQSIAAKLWTESSTSKRKRDKEETVRSQLEIMNVAATEYEFRNCIVGHNLEDDNGDLIDFTKPMQAWRLDPKIGAEIARYIDELNQEDEEDLDPLEIAPSFSFSEDEKISATPSTEQN